MDKIKHFVSSARRARRDMHWCIRMGAPTSAAEAKRDARYFIEQARIERDKARMRDERTV